MTTKRTTTEDAPDCIGFAVRVRELKPDAHGKKIDGSQLKMRWSYKTVSRTYHAKSAAIDFLHLLLKGGEVRPEDAWVCAVGSPGRSPVNVTTKIEHVKVDDLIPYINNARTHSDSQITQLAASIKEFGWGAPLLIDKDNGVIAGHARLLAAKKLKREHVPCVRLKHLSDAQRKAMILADNRIALSGGWDSELLAFELDELRDLKYDLSITGFEPAELNELVGTPNVPPLPIEDQSRLDQRSPVICPKCSHEFIP